MTSAPLVCPLCAASPCEVVYDLTLVQSPDDVPGLVARCRSCALWFKQLTDPNGIPVAYPGEYGEDDIADRYLRSTATRDFFRAVLGHVRCGVRSGAPRLLDIGAGQGALLEEAVRMGFAAEGIDRCESNVHAARARGLNVQHGAAEALDREDMFDVITMMDIIEHLPDPLRVLKAAHRALTRGGELVVYTPNHRAAVVVLAKLLNAVGVRYPIREIFGRNHVCFFDDRSLPLAVQTAGFEVRMQQHLPYDPARPGQYVSPLNLAVVRLAEWLGKPFNRVFRLLAYARKPVRA
jgi:2-polyprenyl-3-methyl-5-hydroxy-6-metoxy-1,4-benzoquinol methylase